MAETTGGSATIAQDSPSSSSARKPPSRSDVNAAGTAEPRWGGIWAALTYAVCTMVLAYPALGGKFLAGPHSDQFIAGYAFREFGASTLQALGQFPLWNPYLFGGLPFVAAMHGDIFYPTFLLRMLMPTDVAMTWSFIIHMFLAGLFTYHFLRVSGFGFFGSLFGGIAYMMSGQLASLVSPGHDGKLYVSALLPLSLWMLTRGLRDGMKWSWGVLAVVIGLAVLSPHPQLLQYLLLAAGAYSIFLAVSTVKRGSLERRDAFVRLARALGAVILGMAMGAIQYLPVREYVAWSPRAGGISDYSTATSYAWPLKEIFDAYLPQFTGMLDAYWGENGIHFHSDYIGVVVLVVAGAAFSKYRRDPARGQLLFWGLTFVISTLWAFGGDTPFYRIPYALVPGTRYFRAPETVFFVGTLALAFLSAAGVERILSGEVSRRYAVGWLVFSGLVVLLGSTGALTAIAQTLAPDAAVDSVDANSLQMILGAWRSFAFVVAAVALILYFKRGKFSVRVAGWAFVALVAVDLWTVMRHYWIFSQPAATVYATDPAIDHIKSERQPVRVLAVEFVRSGRDPNLIGDGLMIHDIRTVLGYHGNQLGRYNELLQKDQGYQQVLNPNVWKLLNVRFLLTNVPDVGSQVPGAQLVVGPVTDAAGVTVFLYRLPGENPYAWVTPVIVKAEDEAVGQTILDPRFDVRRAALFGPDVPVTAVANLAALPEPLPISTTVTSYAPGKASIRLSAPAPAGAALMISENYYPGWRATADGKPAVVGRADYSLMGVQLPVGATSVDLAFHSEPYERGKLITFVALALALALTVAGVVAERRKRG
ncbi:MAG: hypothetical protein WKF55_05200 [Gemmatimonadaceae bacterium]